MINRAENNRNLPKPSLADHRVPEPPSERVSVDINTLLSQSNYLSLRATYPTGRFYKNKWLEKHNRHVTLLKARSNASTVIIGDSIAAGLMRYKDVWDEHFTRDTVNCGMGGDKTQNVLWRSKNIPLPQSLKYVVINCGTNNLETDNPDEISDGLICIALLFQKRMKHLQIVVNGLIPRDAIKTQTETKTVRNKPIATRQMQKLHQCLLPRTRNRLDNPRWWAQQNFLLQRQHPSPQKRKQRTGTIN